MSRKSNRNRNRNRNRNTNHPAVPQDHRPAQDKPRTITVKGVDLTIDPRSLDDWELMESLYDLQSDPQNNALSVVPFMRRFFGDDYQRVKDALREPDTGVITGDDMAGFVQELLERLNETLPNS